MLGAGIIVATFILGPENVELVRMAENPIGQLFANHWFYSLVFVLLIVGGVIVQMRVNRNYTIEEYNRWESF